MENKANAHVLERTIGLAECVTITAGAVIGVGLFTVGCPVDLVGILPKIVRVSGSDGLFFLNVELRNDRRLRQCKFRRGNTRQTEQSDGTIL